MAAKPQQIYLDHNATAPMRPAVVELMCRLMGETGNASSVHGAGRRARGRLETARGEVAALAGVQPGNVVFTSGGTEAANLAVQGLARTGRVSRVIVSAIEHACVHAAAGASGLAQARIPVSADGNIDLPALGEMLEQDEPALVCVMLANNETGAIQPVAEVVELAHDAGALVLVDAVQAAGRVPLDFDALGCDLMTLSAHKLGGPQGAGALILRDGLAVKPVVAGGGQERGLRGGTENVAGIAGFGAAALEVMDEVGKTGGNESEINALRDRLESGLQAISPDHVIFAHNAERLANTSCFALPGLAAETALIALDLEGIAVSSGSACSSGKVGASHVLAAMGVENELARGAIRVSLGAGNTAADIEMFLHAWDKLAARRGSIAA